MQLKSFTILLSIVAVCILFSCNNSNEEQSIRDRVELHEQISPLDYLSRLDNEIIIQKPYQLSLDGFQTKEIVSLRSNCPAADHANTQYEWAVFKCTTSNLYCGYLATFWYTHLIIAYVECDIETCPAYLWAIGSIQGSIDYWTSQNMNSFYINNLNQQLDMLKAIVASKGC